MLKPGWTLRYLPDTKNHLWLILSDPQKDPDRIVFVNFTSWGTLKDQSCVLDAGDHQTVQHKTCVHYRGAMVKSTQE